MTPSHCSWIPYDVTLLGREGKGYHKALIFFGCFLFLLFGCGEKAPRNKGNTHPPENPEKITVPTFDGRRAFERLVDQTKFGPRVANTPAHQSCLSYLENLLREYADTVYLQPFVRTGYDGKQLRFSNIIAGFNLRASSRILFCAHWDSRPRADKDSIPGNRTKPIPGANDGASGVAVLLEVARHLKAVPPAIGVDMALFDGEDYGRPGDLDNYLLGSRHFVNNNPLARNPEFAVLLDMVGDAQLEIPQERNSILYAPDIVDMVWSIAEEVGSGAFIRTPGFEVYDDHVPLNEAGIKAIDIIDFDYPDQSNRYWHTVQDTPDKCSAQSLEQVGNVLLHLIYRKPR